MLLRTAPFSSKNKTKQTKTPEPQDNRGVFLKYPKTKISPGAGAVGKQVTLPPVTPASFIRALLASNSLLTHRQGSRRRPVTLGRLNGAPESASACLTPAAAASWGVDQRWKSSLLSCHCLSNKMSLKNFSNHK